MTGNLITLVGIMTWNTAQLMGGKDYVEIFAPSYAAQKIGVKPAHGAGIIKNTGCLCTISAKNWIARRWKN
ncbi:hypothetical protein D6J78_24880 [Salmonella enterica subsp. enterica serovar Abaetetuba]|nr:hypothetical protein [Salmonella enterica subsp. enterica serovar Abaetetuba]ECD1969824.1 hypothetical protein [Salmonella enterica subsp. enterica serovar Abaetetuba]